MKGQQENSGFIQAATGLVFWIALLLTYLAFPVVYPGTYALIYHYTYEAVGPGFWVLNHLSWMWGVALAFLIFCTLNTILHLGLTALSLRLARLLITRITKD